MVLATVLAALLASASPLCGERDGIAVLDTELWDDEQITEIEGVTIRKRQDIEDLLGMLCPGQEISITISSPDGDRQEMVRLIDGGRAQWVDVEKPKPKKRRWYGWQTLIADGASLTVFLSASSAESGPLAGAAGVGYLFASPLIHVGHQNWKSTWISLGLRVGAPLVGYFAGAALTCVDGDCGGEIPEALAGAAFGVVLGFVAASVIDSTVLARERDVPEVEVEEEPKERYSAY
jgi:hypothetical protein